MKVNHKVNNSGFTLIEICVAIVIVALGILTSMSILLPALKWAGESKVEFGAAQAVESAIAKAEEGLATAGTDGVGAHGYVNCGKYQVRIYGLASGYNSGVDTRVYRRIIDPNSGYKADVGSSVLRVNINLSVP